MATRPKTMSYVQFLTMGTQDALPRASYTLKANGFSLRLCREVEGDVLYTKEGHRMQKPEGNPRNIFEAIALFIAEMDPPMIRPAEVRFGGDHEPMARELYFEFSAYSRNGSDTDDLQLLFHKKCIDPSTGRLDTKRFGYRITIFDARFNEEGETQAPWWKRHQSIADSFLGRPRSSIIFRSGEIDDARELLNVLHKEEGLVCHLLNGECRKIKMPHFVIRTRLLAAGRNIDDPSFIGFNRFVLGVPLSEDNLSWRVICILDYGEMLTDFTRPRRGKAFIPPQSIQIDGDGRLACKGTFILQGLMHSLHQAVTRTKPLKATQLTPRKAVVGDIVITIGKNRKFQFEACDRFLDTEVKVTLGATELWLLAEAPAAMEQATTEHATEDVHLQPPMLLALEGYGHPAYNEMPITSHSLLLCLAKEKPEPYTAYNWVGMFTDPFLGLRSAFIRNVTEKTFDVE